MVVKEICTPLNCTLDQCITANTLIKLINIDVGGGEDGKTVTLDNADHSFVDGETLTFRVSNPGWDNTDVMTNWSTDVVALRESLLSGDVTTNSIHSGSYNPGDYRELPQQVNIHLYTTFTLIPVEMVQSQ